MGFSAGRGRGKLFWHFFIMVWIGRGEWSEELILKLNTHFEEGYLGDGWEKNPLKNTKMGFETNNI